MVQELDLLSYNLEFIPEEILIGIVECLDWKDVLRLRLTCKRFYATSTAKSVWEGLLASHQQKGLPSLRVLEKPAEFYTSEELERLFLHWQKVKCAWLKNTSDLKQTWFTPPEALNQVYLLRGGRWLLCCDCYGEVSYCNLDAGPPELTPLIPAPDFPDRSSRLVLISVDEDWTSPILSFNVAICSTPCFTQERTHINIWRGTLVLDDQRKSLGLKAEHLFHLPISPVLMTPCESISLLGSYIAFDAGPTDREGKASIVIVDWKKGQIESQCSSKTLMYDRSELSMSITLQLLPGDRILSKVYQVNIFDHSQIPEGASVKVSKPAVPLTYLNDTSVHRNTLHPITCTGDDRFIRWDNRGIWGLSVSKDAILGGQEIAKCSLLKWPLWVLPNDCIKAHFTYNYGLLGGEESLFFVRYTWPGQETDDEELLPSISQRRFPGMGPSSSLQMNLFSGKIVCLDSFRNICISDVL